jgi:hypothetical protein
VQQAASPHARQPPWFRRLLADALFDLGCHLPHQVLVCRPHPEDLDLVDSNAHFGLELGELPAHVGDQGVLSQQSG